MAAVMQHSTHRKLLPLYITSLDECYVSWFCPLILELAFGLFFSTCVELRHEIECVHFNNDPIMLFLP